MRVYLAAAMTSPSRDPVAVGAILQSIESLGHHVPTRHVALPDARRQDAPLSTSELARRDLAWIAEADAMIAEVSTPSHGVGIEVATALARPIPVLLLYREGTLVSRLLLGLPGVQAVSYRTGEEASSAVTGFLAGTGAA